VALRRNRPRRTTILENALQRDVKSVDAISSAVIHGMACRKSACRIRGNPYRPATPARRMPIDLESFLARHGIEAQRVEHPPVMTVEESLRLVPPLPGAKTKNLFLRNKKGDRHFLVTIPHHLAVDLDALGILLGAGRIGFASAERLLKHLGVAPGSVSLLALVNDASHAVAFVIDRRLWDAEAVHAHPLVNHATLAIPHAQLERFLTATGHSVRVIDVPGRLP
jgi:Ala-tRNA(Pro) deacylase